jgi:hypothetical protein
MQLNNVLKQGEVGSKKLSLTRTTSATVPFTIISVTANPCNDDVLAVAGLKVSSSCSDTILVDHHDCIRECDSVSEATSVLTQVL